jgi:hypothetical protein
LACLRVSLEEQHLLQRPTNDLRILSEQVAQVGPGWLDEPDHDDGS